MTGIRCTNLLQHIPHEQGHGYPRTPTVVPFDQAPRAAAAKHLLPALRPTHCRVCDRRSPSCSLTLCADQSLSKRASSPRGCRRTPPFLSFRVFRQRTSNLLQDCPFYLLSLLSNDSFFPSGKHDNATLLPLVGHLINLSKLRDRSASAESLECPLFPPQTKDRGSFHGSSSLEG